VGEETKILRRWRGIDTNVSLPCLVMLQRVSRSYKGHQISEKFDTNEEVK
jgi:hypothetical protein